MHATEPMSPARNFPSSPDRNSLCIVTGANGWLGRRMVRALTGGIGDIPMPDLPGRRVRCFVPAGEDTSLIEELGAEVVRGDVRDQAAVDALFDGASGATVYHLAGVIHPARVRDFLEINREGTARILEAATQAEARRLVVMSSNSPFGANPDPEHLFDEDSAYNPYMGYGHSKWQMELALRAAASEPGRPEIVIARAPWFYGPGQPPRQTLFFSMIRAGKFPIFGPGTNKRSMGYVDSLVYGLALCGAKPEAAGKVFWIADERPYTMNEIIGTVGEVLEEDFGLSVARPPRHVPGLVADIARVADRGLQSVGLYAQKIHVLSEMNLTIACDIGRAKEVLGYRPLVDLREGMRRSVEWCLRNGQEI